MECQPHKRAQCGRRGVFPPCCTPFAVWASAAGHLLLCLRPSAYYCSLRNIPLDLHSDLKRPTNKSLFHACGLALECGSMNEDPLVSLCVDSTDGKHLSFFPCIFSCTQLQSTTSRRTLCLPKYCQFLNRSLSLLVVRGLK